MRILIAAAALCALPVAALAQTATPPTGLYGTLGYADAHIDSVNLGVIQGRLGWRYNNWLGFEGELAGGVKSDTSTITVAGVAVNTKVKANDGEAIYGVGFLPLSNNFDLLARVGYGHFSVKASATAVGTQISASQTAEGDSWNYGVGAQYYFDAQNGVRGDYTHQEFTGNNSGHADVWSIAYSRRF